MFPDEINIRKTNYEYDMNIKVLKSQKSKIAAPQ